MNILLLEDEIPAYEKLLKHLELYFKKGLRITWFRTIAKAKRALTETNDYDIIFSDIELLDGSSIDLFKEIKITCPIIFCTAYNEYILDAFKSNGIAYILKPYTQQDIDVALDKYKTLFKKNAQNQLDSTILKDVALALLEMGKYKERFIIKTPKGIHLLSVKDISYIEASGTFCKLIDYNGVSHLFSQSISLTYSILNPKHFFKINRSQIVNIDHIIGMENYFKNRLLLRVKGSKNRISTSSSTTAKFRIWLDS